MTHQLAILSMAFTYRRTIWFGTYPDWAYKFDVQTMEWTQVYDSINGGGLPSNFVYATGFGKNGEVWFGTKKGLTQWKGNKWKTWPTNDSQLPADYIRPLSVNSKGDPRIGTKNELAEFNEEGIIN